MKKNKNIKGLTSIIIPTWIPQGSNKEHYVEITLKSLAKATDKPFEIIIFNNEATERSNKFLKSFKKYFNKNKYCNNFRIISHSENQGWTGGLQIGIESAKGEYVNFTNDDLAFEDKWLSRSLKHFKKNVAAVGPISNFVSGLQSVTQINKNDYEEKVNFLIGFCMLVKRNALDKIIRPYTKEVYYIDPRFFPGGSEELDVCYRLKKAGYDLIIAKDVFIHHFGSKSLTLYSEYDKLNPMNFFKPRMEKLEKKHGKEVRKIIEFQHSPEFAIGIPTIGQTDNLFLANYPWFLQKSWAKFGFNNVLPIVSPRNVVHFGRSEIVKTAITYGAEFLLFIDDDMIIPEDTLLRLASYNKDFISAIAYKRTEPYHPCVFTGKHPNGSWLPDTRIRQGLIKVDTTGLSCALVKMDVIKKLIKKIGKKRIRNRGGLFYFGRFGEDMNFCKELKDMGVDIYVDSNLVVDHLGRRLKVNHKTFASYQKQKQLEEQENLNKGRSIINNKQNKIMGRPGQFGKKTQINKDLPANAGQFGKRSSVPIKKEVEEKADAPTPEIQKEEKEQKEKQKEEKPEEKPEEKKEEKPEKTEEKPEEEPEEKPEKEEDKKEEKPEENKEAKREKRRKQ